LVNTEGRNKGAEAAERSGGEESAQMVDRLGGRPQKLILSGGQRPAIQGMVWGYESDGQRGAVFGSNTIETQHNPKTPGGSQNQGDCTCGVAKQTQPASVRKSCGRRSQGKKEGVGIRLGWVSKERNVTKKVRQKPNKKG